MATKPTEYPDWAENPPAGVNGEDAITVPNAAQIEGGWGERDSVRNPNGRPLRGIANWLSRAQGRWVRWLDQSLWRPGDVFNDGAVPGVGTPPTLGAGAGISAGDFSAAVIVNGYRVQLTPSPAHTYALDSDTYWDLGADGTWTAAVVASGAAAPAVTSGAVRVYGVRTTGSTRSSVFLDARDATSYLEVDKSLRATATQFFSHNGLYHEALSSLGETVRTVFFLSVNSGISGSAGPSLVVASNAAWNGSAWQRQDDAADAYAWVFGGGGLRCFRHPASAPSTWADTVAADTWVSTVLLAGGIKISSASEDAANSVNPRTIPAAYGRVLVQSQDQGATAISGPSYNVASVTTVPANGRNRVTFARAMSGTYLIVAGNESRLGQNPFGNRIGVPANQDANGFDIIHYTEDTTSGVHSPVRYDAGTDDGSFMNFIVYGTLA